MKLNIDQNLEFKLGLLACLLFLLYFYISRKKWCHKYLLAFTLPGPKALPIIGNGLIMTDNQALQDIGNNSYKKYGPIFRVWLSVVPVIVILEPSDIQNVLATHKNTEKIYFYKFMHNFLGNGLITRSGKSWKSNRKLLQPSFTVNVLETFLDTFAESGLCLLNKLKENTKSKTEFNITSFINHSVLDILNEAVLGVPIKQNINRDCDSPFRKGKVLTQDRIARPWLLLDTIYNLTENAKNELNQKQNLNHFTRQMIDKRKEERKNGIYKKDRTNLLDRMLDIGEEHPEFTDDDIVNEVCTFMLAGQESVATSVSFCLYYLAKHKNIQQRVYNELETIFEKSDRVPNFDDLNQMKYLEQCMKETLRLSPSVPLVARKLGESIKVGNYILPEGTDVVITPYTTHRLPHIYPNPLEFDPDRFTPEEIEKRHSLSFIPFSAGPRNCIGYKFAMLEMKTLISTVIRNFELSVKPGYTMNHAFRITLRATGGIWLKFTPRK